MTIKTVLYASKQWIKKPVYLNELVMISLCAVFFVFFENIAFWQKTIGLFSWSSWRDYLLFASFIVCMLSGMAIIFAILLWRPIFKYLLAFFLMISATINYFCLTYGVYIDRDMMQNVMRTDSPEALALITPQFIVWLMLFGLLPVLFLFKIKFKTQPGLLKRCTYRLLFICGCMLMALAVAMPLYKEYASFFRNNSQMDKLLVPTNYIHAVISYTKLSMESSRPLVAIGTDAKLSPPKQGSKPTIFIMVVGEASRAQNFSLLGYQRLTNPLLSNQPGVVAFQNVTSCGTATAYSVPCMFSNMTRKDYSASQARHQENVLDVLQRAGVDVLWKDNNTGCQGQCSRIESIFVRDEQRQACEQDYCYDDQLLDNLNQYISQHNGKNMVIVLHTIGSHGPAYYRRYSRNEIMPFQPACDTNQIQNCSEQALINVYDNTILNQDYLLNKTIDFLKNYDKQYDVAMLYMSDHGQSLGENGIYLHGMPYSIAPEQQTRIPMILWASQAFMQSRQVNNRCMMQQAKNKVYSHDNLFHTMLGAMRVTTTEYQPSLDVFNACQDQPTT